MPANWNRFTLRDLDVPIGGIFATGSAVILLRMILEDLLEKPQQLNPGLTFYENLIDLAHVFLCWWLVLLSLAVIVSAILRHPLRKVLSAMIIGLPLILVVPVLDAAWSGGTGYWIQYQTDLSRMGWTLLHLFDPAATIPGIPPGVRVEIGLAAIGLALYGRLVIQAGWLRTIAACAGLFLVIFPFGFLPAFYQAAGIKEFKAAATPGAFEFIRMLAAPLLILLTGMVLRLVQEQPGGWKLVRKAIYPSRMTAYGGAFLAGYLLIRLGSAATATGLSPAMETLRVITALTGIWFLFLSSKFRNDIIDLPADRISTPDRPLVTGEMSVQTASQLSGIFIVISLPLLIQGGRNLLSYWLVFCAISHLYVSRHLNVRRIYPLGQAAIAAMIVFLVLAGAELTVDGGTVQALKLHPLFIPGVFLMAFLVANLKDFRDLEGDRIAGYRSLPMLFENPLRAVPWLIIGTAVIVSILSLSIGVPMIPVGGILLIYLYSGFRTLRRISGFHEMDKITVLTIWTVLACLAGFVLNHLFTM